MKSPYIALWSLLLLLIYLKKESEGAKILFLTPLGSKSHKGFFMAISEELAKAGHQVTMVSTHKPAKEKKNIREIVLNSPDAVKRHSFNMFDRLKQDTIMKDLILTSPEMCSNSLATDEMQQLKKEHFDLVILSIFFSPCFASLSHHYQAPLIHASPAGLFGPLNALIGNTDFTSLHKTELLGDAKFPYSFFIRLKSTLISCAFDFMFNWYMLPSSDKMCRKAGLCPPDMPSLKDLNENSSLMLLNSVRNFDTPPKPLMPNVIHLGGIHCRPAQNLPKELEEFVSSATDGFIFFSLGSAIHRPSDMPEDYLKILVKVFGSLKQKVIWKWDQDTIDDLPPNVLLGKWLPQQDLLGHKNMKLFITHGGISSTLEASYHGVPIIGMPVFGDQRSNIAQSAQEGWAVLQEWVDLEEDSFRKLIINVIAKEEFRRTVKQRSKIMKDLPRSPGEEAVFWIEYVLRHDGADHIKSPVFQLYTYELYNMDVWIVIFGILILIFFLAATCISWVFKSCFASKKKPKRKRA